MSEPSHQASAVWKTVEAEFRNHGFLAPSITHVRDHYRTVMADWFGLAEDLNALAQKLYLDGSDLLPGRAVRDPVALVLQMLPRCLAGYQGALILAERGLGIEAQALVRGVFETAFWMGYVANDPDQAIPQLERDTLNGEIGLFEAASRHLKGLPESTIEECGRQLAEMKVRRGSLPKAPTIETLADKGGAGPSYFFYRDLSGAAIHMSMKAIHAFLAHSDEGNVVGHQIGPDDENAGKAVWLACRALVIALDAVQRTTGISVYEQALDNFHERISELRPYQG